MSSALITSHRDDAVTEANRLLTICNACRYCEGYCPVFPAMTEHRSFDQSTVYHLANLCHQCTACYHACQYKPPHELQVNLPPVLAALRKQTYAEFVWPQIAAPLFRHNGLFAAIVVSLTVITMCLAMYVWAPAGTMTSSHIGPGAFYAVLPHHLMAGIAGAIVSFGLLSVCVSCARYARYCGLDRRMLFNAANWAATLRAVATLQHLGGGHGEGCNTEDAQFSNRRRYFHQFTMWGFMLCFLATATATVYELWLGRLSPFPYLSLPVAFGTLGGVALVIGPAGLLWLKRRAHTEAMPADPSAMDTALTVQLLLISITGLVLLALRGSNLMPWLLIVHLGLVYGFFVTLPFSKFVHGVYRTLALLRYSAGTSNKS